MKQTPIETKVVEGTIHELSVERSYEDFLMKRHDRTRNAVQATAAVAALAGMGALAVGTASMANARTSEPADYTNFKLVGKPFTFKGWMWRFPFKEGEQVKVVIGKMAEGWRLLAVWQPDDGRLAIFPHTTRGTMAHWLSSLKTWFWVALFFWVCVTPILIYAGAFGAKSSAFILFILYAPFSIFMFLGAIPIAWKFMPSVRLANAIYSAFGWKDASRINLYKTSKVLEKDGEESCKASCVFRYLEEAPSAETKI